MSKIRIYELAKELGVENKIVINHAIALGFKGKNSHSHSLENDEVEQIRKAVSGSGTSIPSNTNRILDTKVIKRSAANPASHGEVVTTRIDKSTGQSESVVEKRRGDVIMRRRQGAPEAVPAVEEQKENLSQTISDNILSFTQQTDSKTEDEKESNNLIAPSTEEKEIESLNNDSQEAKFTEPGDSENQPLSAVTEEVEDSSSDIKKYFGPKILGKIELPVKKQKVVETKKVFSNTVNAEVPDTEEEALRRKKALGAGNKSKKREISRGDLIDYEGRDFRKNVKGGKSGKASDRDKHLLPDLSEQKAAKNIVRVVKLGDSITVGDLAKQMSLKSGEVISKLIQLGVLATINQLIDKDTATLIAEEFGCQIESTSIVEKDLFEEEVVDPPESLQPKSPVVTVMGHVDHGKTSLLDRIRKASVADKEAGGITQHIGAYQVVLPSNKSISFIDTPGHAAFTAMRARGAKVTDIVILVVSADDGVMPQTIEAINHAKSAEVPIIVAVNKIDKQGANPDKVKQQLVEYGLQPEDWGGQTMFFPISALKGLGIEELLEGVLLQADVMELKANPNRKAKGTIIESRQDRGRGNVATILVQHGTLKVGDIFVSGAISGRVRSMVDHNGKKVDKAVPATPVEITGLSGIPSAGDDLIVVESEAQAKQIAELRSNKIINDERALSGGPISLEEFSRRANSVELLELNIILKADVNGSLEAVKSALEQASTDKVRVKVIHSAVGGVNESDVQLAVASKGIIVGFGVRGEPRALDDAERYKIDVRFYRIIYELIDDMKKAMAGLLDPVKQEVFLGRAEVRETFQVPKLGTIAGSYVIDGTIKRGRLARVLRDSRVIYEGKLGSLRRFKDDVKEVAKGYECGIGVENFSDVKVGDVLEVFEVQEVAATL